jgi:hypothetical protein
MPYEGEGIYRHYKGGLYQVLGLGLEEASLAPVVVYAPVDGNSVLRTSPNATMWTRPLEDFNAMVSLPLEFHQFDKPEKAPPMISDLSEPVARFTKLTRLEIMQTRNERLLEWARQIDLEP